MVTPRCRPITYEGGSLGNYGNGQHHRGKPQQLRVRGNAVLRVRLGIVCRYACRHTAPFTPISAQPTATPPSCGSHPISRRTNSLERHRDAQRRQRPLYRTQHPLHVAVGTVVWSGLHDACRHLSRRRPHHGLQRVLPHERVEHTRPQSAQVGRRGGADFERPPGRRNEDGEQVGELGEECGQHGRLARWRLELSVRPACEEGDAPAVTNTKHPDRHEMNNTYRPTSAPRTYTKVSFVTRYIQRAESDASARSASEQKLVAGTGDRQPCSSSSHIVSTRPASFALPVLQKNNSWLNSTACVLQHTHTHTHTHTQ